MSKLVSALLVAGLAAALPLSSTEASPIRSGFDANVLPANDDDSTGSVSIGFSVDFYGLTFTNLFVNNNGNVTFDEPLETFTPFSLTSTGRQIIAPFFADVDTRGAGSNVATYGTGTVDGRAAFGVNWLNVGYYAERDDLLNSFQLILVERSDAGAGAFDIEFNYGQILWETGEASDGIDGLGGDSARVGFSNGTGAPGTFLEFLGSGVNGAFLDGGPAGTSLVRNSLNSDLLGRYVLQARGGVVVIPDTPPAVIPLPATLPLLFGGLAFLAVGARRRPRV